MELLISVFVVMHLLALSAILGGWLARQLGADRGLAAMVWGARLQVIIGLILVGLNEAAAEELNYVKIAVKALVGVAVVAGVEIARVRAAKGRPTSALVNVAAGLTVLNVAVAVLWAAAS